jgi:hypothetical protein
MTVFDLRCNSNSGVSERVCRYLNEQRLSLQRIEPAWWCAGVVEWLMAPGCKPGGLRLYEGSNPSPSTIRKRQGDGVTRRRGETLAVSVVSDSPRRSLRAGVAQW